MCRGSNSLARLWITSFVGNLLYGVDKVCVWLDEYWIAKTPVTNQQYKAFVDATGYAAPLHWETGKIPHGKENHPVVRVSSGDSVAFCRWAGHGWECVGVV